MAAQQADNFEMKNVDEAESPEALQSTISSFSKCII